MSQNDRELACALYNVAAALDRLGTNHAAEPMGAIELLAKELREGLHAIAAAIAEATK